MSAIEMTPIGIVSNNAKDLVDENWGSVISRLELKPQYSKGITGLDQFTHAIVITYLDRAAFKADEHLVRKPRGLQSMPEVGIFAQRAKDRPNPIGITAVRIVHVGIGFVEVQGLDAIDGTPIIDIKPYYHHYDMIKESKVPEWVDRLMEGYFQLSGNLPSGQS